MMKYEYLGKLKLRGSKLGVGEYKSTPLPTPKPQSIYHVYAVKQNLIASPVQLTQKSMAAIKWKPMKWKPRGSNTAAIKVRSCADGASYSFLDHSLLSLPTRDKKSRQLSTGVIGTFGVGGVSNIDLSWGRRRLGGKMFERRYTAVGDIFSTHTLAEYLGALKMKDVAFVHDSILKSKHREWRDLISIGTFSSGDGCYPVYHTDRHQYLVLDDTINPVNGTLVVQ